MSSRVPAPSSRLVRAADSERAELVRHRERLASKRDQQLGQLRQLDEALAGIDQRLAIISQLVGDADNAPAQAAAERDSNGGHADALQPTLTGAPVLGGPAIRETAVRVLLEQPEYIEAMHYRRWYELLRNRGYAVSGKDPLAVFLTQLTRSPVVRKATQPGVYELDRQAPLRLRQRLERLHAELRALAATHSVQDTADARARRHELDAAISQQERALEEALRVLRPEDVEPQRVSTVAGAR